MGMAVAGALGSTVWAADRSFGYLSDDYSNNFNSLSSTTGATDQTTGLGDFVLVGSGANYNVGTGSSSAAEFYSYGSTSASDRALGSLASGTGNRFGIMFVNNTGATVTQLRISYTGEQWRAAGNAVDRLDFQYSTVNTANISDGATSANWVGSLYNAALGTGDFQSPINTSVGAIDGNNALNRTPQSFLITGLSIANGARFGIRWVDSNSPGSGSNGNDDGLAIDDLLVAVPEPWQPSAVVGAGLLGIVAWKRRRLKA